MENQPPCDDALMLEDDVDQRMTANECHIKKLNKDCLLKIFSYLGLFETLHLEDVCESWRSLINDDLSSKNKLNLDAFFKKTGYKIDAKKLTIAIFRKLLIKCGPNLKTIILSTPISSSSFNKVHEVIAECCPEIEYLDISGLEIDNGTIEGIARTCKKLRTIFFRLTNYTKEEALESLFSENENLIYLALGIGVDEPLIRITGSCLRVLTPRLKELLLQSCEALQPAHLLFGINIFRSLEALALCGFESLTTAVLEEIVDKLPNLTTLFLDYEDLPRTNNVVYLAPIGNLKNLTFLSLNFHRAVNDSFLKLISQSCQDLVTLNISKAGVTENGLAYLAEFPKLTEINLNYILDVCVESLRPLASKGLLQRLSVHGCEDFDDRAILMLVHHCKDLTYLSIDTYNYVINVMEMFPKRKSKEKSLLEKTRIFIQTLIDEEENPK